MINILFFIIPQPIPGTSLEYIVSGTILTALSLESDHHVMSLQAATHHPPFLPFMHIEKSITWLEWLTSLVIYGVLLSTDASQASLNRDAIAGSFA